MLFFLMGYFSSTERTLWHHALDFLFSPFLFISARLLCNLWGWEAAVSKSWELKTVVAVCLQNRGQKPLCNINETALITDCLNSPSLSLSGSLVAGEPSDAAGIQSAKEGVDQCP